jgi:mannose-1-phosphate guanylyltransferase
MAGGSGTRFWPASRSARPKQMLPLAAGVPLITATIDRLAGLVAPERTWVVTNAAQVDGLRALVPALPRAQFVVEPEPRDTAPCIALAAATIAAREPRATMVAMPADHVITPVATFHAAVRRAATLAADDRTLVTFGVQPTRPATGFGYIECGARLDDGAPAACRAARFREKPDADTAAAFLAAGTFLWNSGIFVWTIPALLAAMRTTAPELGAATERMIAGGAAGPDAVAAAFRTAPRTSIDFAVMERAERVAVVRADFGWNDVGGFTALDTVVDGDGDGNHALLAAGSAFLPCQSTRNLVFAEGGRTVCLFGVDDLVVVDTDDAVMVCPRARADELKQLVEHVRSRHPELL